MASTRDVFDFPTVDLFEYDLKLLVEQTYVLTLDGIALFQNRETADIRKSYRGDDTGEAFYEERYIDDQCDELRRAAGNLALVNLVSRFAHRIEKLESESKPFQRPAKKQKASELIRKLGALNGACGDGPVELGFFANLETARDSVVHHDSRKEFRNRNKLSVVATQYHHPEADLWIKFDDDDLKEAVVKVKEQVAWYRKNIIELKQAAKNSGIGQTT